MSEFYETLLNTIRTSDKDFYNYYDDRRSYADLYQAILSINTVLAEYENESVALFALKSFESYSAIYSILLSGNTWVPVNPQMPAGRNADMLRIAQVSIILTDQELPTEIQNVVSDIGAKVISLLPVVQTPAKKDFDVGKINLSDTAIIFFTSGSTGIPKGVPLSHDNFIRTVENVLNIVPFEKGEVFADYHDLGFVLCIPYIFGCVFTESAFAPGIQEQERLIPLNNLAENKVTVLITVPSTISRIRSLRQKGLENSSLRIICLAGEPFHLDILAYCMNTLGVRHVFDFYGSTEVGCWIFSHKCQPDDLDRFADIGFVPIGQPMPGNEFEIGEDEELLVGGSQITRGYLGDIDRQKFFDKEGVRWFGMGDKVIERDGVYFCKGRLDSQVKIGGYRIELMDSEAHLRTIKGIEHAVCFVAENNGRDIIVAGLLGDCDYSASEIKKHLLHRLPDYMIPKKFFRIEEMPLNKSGKVDRIKVRSIYENLGS